LEHQLSAVLKSLRQRHRVIRDSGERGTSLVEVVVAMTIMVVCGAIFTGAVVTLYSVTNRAQAVTNSATQTNQAYQALDKVVRYAAAITTPGLGAGLGPARYWYVELRDTTSGSEVCTQLRVNTSNQQLQRRTWSASSQTTLTSWVQISSGITNGGAAAGSADQPFVLLDPAPPTANHQQLTINLRATSGPASSPATTMSSFRLTALNSPPPPVTGSICHQAGRP
jgi:type II secretory pathway component PulJ